MATKTAMKKWIKKLNGLELAEEIDLDQDLEDLKEDFISTIEELDDEGKSKKIDDDILDFYEDLIEAEDEPEEEEEDEAPAKKKTTRKKTTSKKKAAKDEEEEEEEDEPEEEEDEPEEEEDEPEEEEDELADMSRAELKKMNKEEDLGVRVLKSMSDDDLRDAIREAKAPKKAAGKKATGKKTTGKKGGKRPANFTPSGSVPITEAAAKAIKFFKGKSVEVLKVSKKCNEYRVKGGGKDNVGTAGYYVKFAIKVLTALGHCESDGKKVKFS